MSPGRGRELYLAGHIPGASFLDVDEELSDLSVPDAGRHPLPSAETFAGPRRRGRASGRACSSSRTGRWAAPSGSGGCCGTSGTTTAVCCSAVSTCGAVRCAPGDESIEPAEFVPRERTDDTITAEEIARRLADPGLALVDARPAFRWRGEPNPIDDPPGRIPAPLNAPWDEPQPELPEGELVAYCGSGVTACVVLHRASLHGRDGRLYPGSWSEWSTRGLPIERS